MGQVFKRSVLNSQDDRFVSHQTEAYSEVRNYLLLIFKVLAPYHSADYYFRKQGVQGLVESDLDEFTWAHGNVGEKHHSFDTEVFQLRVAEYIRPGLFDHHGL